MKTSLENVSCRFYAFLDERDVRVLREYYDADGSLVVDALVPEFRMRFVKSGGAFQLLVGSNADNEWHELYQVLQQVTGSPVADEPELLTDYLLTRYEDICAVLEGGKLRTSIAAT